MEDSRLYKKGLNFTFAFLFDLFSDKIKLFERQNSYDMPCYVEKII